MKKAKYYKILFLVAGLWNLVAAMLCWLGLVIMPGKVSRLFGMPQPASLFPFHAMFSFIVVFGIGYFIVSHDIARNQGLVVIGSLGKLLFFMDCLIALVLKEGNLLLLLTGSIDLAFALLFIEFLFAARNPRVLTSVK